MNDLNELANAYIKIGQLNTLVENYRAEFAELHERIQKYESRLLGGLSSDARRIFEMVKETQVVLEKK